MTAQSRSWGQQYALYLPRILLSWQSADEPEPVLATEGTFLLVDISGFTALSEMLAEKGKVGSEEVTALLNEAFTEMLDIAMLDGGDLIRFGGDALFLLYTGEDHAARACRSAVDMQDALDEFQRAKSPAPLEMSVGIATGPITGFLAGAISRELLFVGPTASEVVRLQTAADPGEILVCRTTVGEVDDPAVFGDEKDDGVLLVDAPDADDWDDDDAQVDVGSVDLAAFIPIRLRDHLSLAFNEGEHRPATIAFVKFTGTDELFATHGTEVAAEKLDELVTLTQRIAESHGVSFLASDVNDDGGKLILATGVPERSAAHDERLVMALHTIAASDPELAVHMGVARGHVFAGDLGARFRRVYTVMGDTVNLAARLAAKAAPGEVLVTARALDRSADTFATTTTEPLTLKGKSKPVSPLSIGDPIASTGPAASGAELPLIGRDRELAELVALGDGGGVIEVVARGGMGKSRLVAAALARLAPGTRTVDVNCERYEQATAYHAASQLLLGALGITTGRGGDGVGHELAAAVTAAAPDAVPWLPLLADVVGSRIDATDEVAGLADEFREAKLHEALVSVLQATALQVVVVDDAQWIDDASRRAFAAIAGVAERQGWLVISLRTADEGSPLVDGIATLGLGPLETDEAVRLATAVAGPSLPLPVAEAIAERAGGNPFFVMELAKSRGGFEGGDLPETVEAVTLARIDRLRPNDRRLLRYASVFGETFAVDLLADALPEMAPNIDDVEVWERLDDFLDTGSLGKVRFRQMIVRDVAYAGLPFKRRAEVHLAIAEALERRARRRPERFAEAMSLHFDRAEAWAKAWTYSTMAGDRAAAKMAHVEAIRLYSRALRAAEHVEDAADDETGRIREALGDANEHLGLFDDAEAAFDQILAAEPTSIVAGRVLRKKGFLYVNRGAFDEARSHLDASLGRLVEIDDSESVAARLETMIATAGVYFRLGDYPATIDWCTRAIDLAGEEHEREIAHAFYMRSVAYTHLPGHDGAGDAKRALAVFEESRDLVGQTNVLNNLGYDAYYRGAWDEAVDWWTRSVETGTKSGDIVRTASSIHNLGEIYMDQGHYVEAEPRLRQALRIWEGAAFPVGVGLAHANLGRLYTRTGRLAEAEVCLDQARVCFTDTSANAYVVEERIRRCEWFVYAGESEQALETVDATLAQIEATDGSEVSQAALHRVAGYALAQLGDVDTAATRIEASATLARAAGADWELAQTLEAEARLGTNPAHGAESEQLFTTLGVIARPWIRI